MRAIVVSRSGGPEVLESRQLEEPAPGPDEVLIEIDRVGVNFADVMAREGRYHGAPEPPFVPGLEVAGTVVESGSVSSLREGDLVAAFTGSGGYAERAVASSHLVWPVPAGIDLEQAAAVPVVGVTAYNLLTLAGGLRAGESVLVHSAAGGVGTTAVQIAHVLGAGLVIGTVGAHDKVARAMQAGCDEVIVRGRRDLVEAVRDLTGGRGVDLALDPIAGSLFATTLACVADFGRLVVFGIAEGVAGSLTTDSLHPRNRSVIGYSTGSYARQRPKDLFPAGEAVLRLLRDRQIRMVIGSRYDLDEAKRAHRDLESRSTTGKLLLMPELRREFAATAETGTERGE